MSRCLGRMLVAQSVRDQLRGKSKGQRHGQITQSHHALVAELGNQLGEEIKRDERRNNAGVVYEGIWGEQRIV